MKNLTTSLLLGFTILVVGCTSFTYTNPDGSSVSFVSFKEYQTFYAEIEIEGKVKAKVEAKGVTSDIVEEITSGIVKGMKK